MFWPQLLIDSLAPNILLTCACTCMCFLSTPHKSCFLGPPVSPPLLMASSRALSTVAPSLNRKGNRLSGAKSGDGVVVSMGTPPHDRGPDGSIQAGLINFDLRHLGRPSSPCADGTRKGLANPNNGRVIFAINRSCIESPPALVSIRLLYNSSSL